MIENKSLYDISWKVSEEEYRANSALSYSTLSTFKREGFNGLSHLNDKKESSSLTFGSAVDSIITGGIDEFNSRFIVADLPELTDTMLKIVKNLFTIYGSQYNNINAIPQDNIKTVTDALDYGKTWGINTVVKKVVTACEDYYKLLFLAEDKTILSSKVYEEVLASVKALKESDSTKWYFEDNNPFDDSIQRFYQLKFKDELNGVNYRCMADLLILSRKDKVIYPVDLKTSSHTEWDFYKSFIDWHY